MNKFECLCCGFPTLYEEPPGTYEICAVCGWEDDDIQYANPDTDGGANELSFNEHRKEFFESISKGVVEGEFLCAGISKQDLENKIIEIDELDFPNIPKDELIELFDLDWI